MTVDQFREATGLYARLEGLRGRLDTLPPEGRPAVFRLEQDLRSLGMEPGNTRWPPPPEPTPPLTQVARVA